MYRLIAILLIVLLQFSRVAAQDITSKTVEEQTYAAYLKADWASLIETGKIALKADIDYYYLRFRLGAAYFESGKPALAIKHFEKALKMNPADKLCQEYYYLSLIKMGRFLESRFFAEQKISASNRSSIGYKKSPFVDLLMADGGVKISSKEEVAGLELIILPEDEKPIGKMIYAGAGFNHRTSSRSSLLHFYTYLAQELYWGNYWQNEYYLSSPISFGKGWQITPSLHLIALIADMHEPFQSNQADFNDFFWVASAKAQKACNLFEYGLSMSFSQLYDSSQFQISPSVSVYPFANKKLKLTLNSYLQLEKGNFAHAIKPEVSYQVYDKLNLNLHYYFGNARSVNEANGFLVNNSRDLSANRFSMLAQFQLHRKIACYAIYQFEQKEHAASNINFEYSYQSIITGLKFTP